MAFDSKQAAVEVRNLLTEQSPAAAGLALPRIAAILPSALELWARDAFTSPTKRELLKKTVTASLTNGALDLTPLVDGSVERINLADLRRAPVYLVEESAGEVLIRTFLPAAVNAGDPNVYSKAANFTAADIGRRIEVIPIGVPDAVKFVATIEAIVDAGECVTDTNATDTASFCSAAVYGQETAGIEAAFTWVSSFSQLQHQRLGGVEHPACFLEGYTLRTRGADGSLTSLDGRDVRFTVPVYPAAVSAIPPSLQKDFIDYAANYVKEKLLV